MKKSKDDHAISIIKSGLSAIPIVGGSISSLISDYIPTSSQKIIADAVESIGQKIELMQDRIDIEMIDKEEFSELFKSCYLIMIRSHKKKKLNAATSILVNLLLKKNDSDKMSYTELDHYVRVVESLSIGAIEVLGHIYNLSNEHAKKYIEHENISTNPPKIEAMNISNLLMGVSDFLLNGLVTELTSQHLITLFMLRDKDFQYGDYKILLTPLGFRFTKYVLSESQLSNKANPADAKSRAAD